MGSEVQPRAPHCMSPVHTPDHHLHLHSSTSKTVSKRPGDLNPEHSRFHRDASGLLVTFSLLDHCCFLMCLEVKPLDSTEDLASMFFHEHWLHFSSVHLCSIQGYAHVGSLSSNPCFTSLSGYEPRQPHRRQ